MVVTNHKPLVKVFGDRTLNEIQNTRIFRLKQRTLPWLFEVHYMPGKTNLAADAASRYPTLTNEINLDDGDFSNESLLIASLSNEVCRSMAITWEEIVEKTLNDKVLSRVFRCIEDGRSLKHDESLSAYFRYDEALYLSDGVVLYKVRVVVPLSL